MPASRTSVDVTGPGAQAGGARTQLLLAKMERRSRAGRVDPGSLTGKRHDQPEEQDLEAGRTRYPRGGNLVGSGLNLLFSGKPGGGGGRDGRAPAPLCTTDHGSLGLRGVELTKAPSSQTKHCNSVGRSQEVEGAHVFGFAP